ncbi:related to ribosomal protein [Phialocephala subalpina]|uniref:Small ribosomal subunit protein mS29 n=1 Tax=Phialocephala subalpina TaxID=576137 RepID=A0A1L7WDZ1_9HELO|nr:related to ribosomal protein [Phialocephala subalpina]
MASTNCWRCLSRPSTTLTHPSLLTLSRPSFSTSAILAAAVKKPTLAARSKGQKTLKIKKKAVVKTGKPPAAGERKAMRKRIVLSNTNALEVEGMQDLDEQMVEKLVRKKEEDLSVSFALEAAGEMEAEVVGKVVGLKGETVDSLRAVEAFKTTQGWGLFRRPGLLLREESRELSRRMVGAARGREELRLVIDGEKGSGKSLMLLHAMATAFVKGWVVLNIPEAQEVTNAMNDYAPIQGTTPTLWSQPTYTANWLGQIGKANNAVLQDLQLSMEHNLPIPIQSNISLARLCELGARDPDVAWPIFLAFWAEITARGRPPVLMCLDSLSHVLQNSLYRAPDYSQIHAHDLAIIRHFVDHLSGKAKLPNGGAVIAATSRSHAPISKSLELVIANAEEKAAHAKYMEQFTARQAQHKANYAAYLERFPAMKAERDAEIARWQQQLAIEEAELAARTAPRQFLDKKALKAMAPKPLLKPAPYAPLQQEELQLTPRDPFEKAYDARADKVLENVDVLSLKGISRAEARALMEYWAQSGVLRQRVDEESVAEKWALAGNGIVGEIQRGALWMRI